MSVGWRAKPFTLPERDGIVDGMGHKAIEQVLVEQSEIDLAAASVPGQLSVLAKMPRFAHIMIAADPYPLPKQHAVSLRTFAADVHLANVATERACRMEVLRRGLGRAVDYSLLDSEGSIA